jgi:hypothetical protein
MFDLQEKMSLSDYFTTLNENHEQILVMCEQAKDPKSDFDDRSVRALHTALIDQENLGETVLGILAEEIECPSSYLYDRQDLIEYANDLQMNIARAQSLRQYLENDFAFLCR